MAAKTNKCPAPRSPVPPDSGDAKTTTKRRANQRSCLGASHWEAKVQSGLFGRARSGDFSADQSAHPSSCEPTCAEARAYPCILVSTLPLNKTFSWELKCNRVALTKETVFRYFSGSYCAAEVQLSCSQKIRYFASLSPAELLSLNEVPNVVRLGSGSQAASA